MPTLRDIVDQNVREGDLYETLDRNRVRCFACGHCCPIPDGQPGVCKVRFTQIPGGEVINVEFMSCPYDSEGREFVERALKKTPMPYSGFYPVFMRQVELSFCFPREDCEL